MIMHNYEPEYLVNKSDSSVQGQGQSKDGNPLCLSTLH